MPALVEPPPVLLKPPLGRTHLTPKALEVAERRTVVYRMRVMRATFAQIAEAMNADPRWQGRLPRTYTGRQVHADVMVYYKTMLAEMAEQAELVRSLELSLIDQMQFAIVQRALGTPANPQTGQRAIPADLDAQRQVLALMDKRARYMPGLQVAPSKEAALPEGDGQAPAQTQPPQEFFLQLAVLFQTYGVEHLQGTVEGALQAPRAPAGPPPDPVHDAALEAAYTRLPATGVPDGPGQGAAAPPTPPPPDPNLSAVHARWAAERARLSQP